MIIHHHFIVFNIVRIGDMLNSALQLNWSTWRIGWVNTDNRHIISMKSQGFCQTPQDIMESTMGVQSPSTLLPTREKFTNGCTRVATSFSGRHGIGINPHSQALTLQF